MDDTQFSEPWEEGFYGTGPLHHRKSHGMLIAVLLVLVIFLCGVVSFLSILNIRLFRKLNQPRQQDLILFTPETEPTVSDETMPMDPVTIDLHPSPEAVDTVPEEGGLPLQDIYSKNIPSVVSVTVHTRSGSATGTGVIFSPKGYIITNHHVIDGAHRVSVRLTDDRELEARLVGADDASDLAVLHVDAEDLPPARFGDSDRLRVGDTVVAIGDPLGESLRGTMTNGIISAINRDVPINGLKMNLIQTNAALNSGNSGGPLIDCFGQVVGINTMKIGAFADVAGVEGIGFAIPSAIVKDVAEQLIMNGYVSGRPTLGIEGEQLSPFYQRFYHLPAGLYITRVIPDGPGDKVGINQGDVLLRLDGTRISTMQELSSFLYAHSIGDEVSVEIFRDGRIGSAAVTLAEKTN